MSHTVPIEKAAANLSELVGGLRPGDEIVLTEEDRPVARILPSETTNPVRRPGLCKGMLSIERDDDEHLEDFKPYMP